MSRYIEEKDVYKLVEPNGVARVHCSQIDELPRADVVEVRRGKWIVTRFPLAGDYRIESSCCNLYEMRGPAWNITWGLPNYCPNCGAKMDVEKREDI
jgi:hypothetical protein